MNLQLMNYDGLNFVDSQIGCVLADESFVVAPECLDTLENLLDLLENEDINTRPMRRRFMLMGLVKKSLIPLLLNMDEVDGDDRDNIFMLTIKLLAHLTQPIDCLLTAQCLQSQSGQTLKQEIESFIHQTQYLFTKPSVNKVILSEVLDIFQKHGNEKLLPQTQSEIINFTIYLYRNLLFSVDKESSNDSLPVHAEILRWMLEYNIKEALLQTITGPQVEYWCVALVQMLSLMFKDDRCMDDELSSTARVNFETMVSPSQVSTNILSSSCDDHISSKASKDSDSVGTRDVQDDPVKGSKGQQVEDEQKLSEEAKLQVRVSEAGTWQQIREGMSELCREFLLKGFAPLLKAVKATLLGQNRNKYQLQPHYFLWLVQNFSRLLPVYETPFTCVQECFTVDTVGFLVFQSVTSLEQLLITSHLQQDVAPLLKQNYLPLVALHMMINAVSYYWQTESTHQIYLLQLMTYLVSMKDLQYTLVMTIRRFDMDILGKDYLREAILTTHKFMLMADVVIDHGGQLNFEMLSYVKNFATNKMMMQYCQVLQDFETNPRLLNDCVFTMMHHVAGDCEAPSTLLQLPILQAFLNILDMPAVTAILPQECSNLMEYILQTCLGKLDSNPLVCVSLMVGIDMETEQSEAPDKLEKSCDEVLGAHAPWSEEEENELCAIMSRSDTDSLEHIMKGLSSMYIDKTHEEVVTELCRCGYWSVERMMEELSLSSSSQMMKHDMEPERRHNTLEDDIKQLMTDGHSDWLQWLQTSLQEVCYTKAIPDDVMPKEPIFWHCALLGHSMPLVPYTDCHEQALANEHFTRLLHSLELELPAPLGVAYPRIPSSWSPALIWSKAELLAPIKKDAVIFQQIQVAETQSRISEPYTRIDDAQLPRAPAPNPNIWPILVDTLNRANMSNQVIPQ